LLGVVPEVARITSGVEKMKKLEMGSARGEVERPVIVVA
jgi:hypothetical protein